MRTTNTPTKNRKRAAKVQPQSAREICDKVNAELAKHPGITIRAHVGFGLGFGGRDGIFTTPEYVSLDPSIFGQKQFGKQPQTRAFAQKADWQQAYDAWKTPYQSWCKAQLEGALVVLANANFHTQTHWSPWPTSKVTKAP